tara:strand:- start:60446 stop:60691 length:246 start_codon:yes stop_codon:yes gene_type:complete
MNNKANNNKQVNLFPKSIVIPVAQVAIIVLVISFTQSKKTEKSTKEKQVESVSVISSLASPRISSMFNCRDKKRSTQSIKD